MVTTAQQAELDAVVRRPRYLAQFTLGGTVFRIASARQVTFDGNTFSKTGLDVRNLKTGKGGIQTCRVMVQNENHVWTQILVSMAFTHRPMKVWKYYGDSDPSTDDAVVAFDGQILAVPSIGDHVVFDCVSTNGATKEIPNVTLGPPEVKHMPYPGQRLIFPNEIYTIEVR
jgi:hypothetical protein